MRLLIDGLSFCWSHQPTLFELVFLFVFSPIPEFLGKNYITHESTFRKSESTNQRIATSPLPRSTVNDAEWVFYIIFNFDYDICNVSWEYIYLTFVSLCLSDFQTLSLLKIKFCNVCDKPQSWLYLLNKDFLKVQYVILTAGSWHGYCGPNSKDCRLPDWGHETGMSTTDNGGQRALTL